MVLLLAASLASAGVPAEEGLLAWWPCDEGQGEVVHDAGGHGHDGRLSHVEWVPFGDGFCLRFNGRDSQVEMAPDPGLEPTAAVTVECWLRPDGPAKGEPGVVGKGYSSFVLTYYTDGKCWWYVGGGGSNVNATVSLGAWHHVVGTFDGSWLRLYVDGREAASRQLEARTVPAGGAFYFGTSSGEVQFTKDARFDGLLDEVRLYDRALTATEVAGHYRTTHLSGRVEVTARAAPFAGELTVLADLRGLGDLPADAVLRLAVSRRLSTTELTSVSLPVGGQGEASAVLELGDEPPGPLDLQATVVTGGEAVGQPVTLPVDWPTRSTWPEAPALRVLNNLVTELLAVHDATGGEWSFTNPREGWLFLRADVRGQARLLLDGQPVIAVAVDGPVEAMRRVSAGEHQVRLEGTAADLVVRAIPELIFAQYGANPHVHEFGTYEQEFLGRYVDAQTNVMIGPAGEALRLVIEAWRGQGKKWFGSCPLPGRGEAVTADEAAEFWRRQPGLADPLFDGTLIDEFNGFDAAHYDAWREALHQLHHDPATRGRLLYPYGHLMAATPWGKRFCEEVIAGGGKFAMERYLPEQPGEVAAYRCLEGALLAPINAWRQLLPGSERHLVVVVGTFSQPPESLDVDPGIDHKVWLDLQFHALANDPAAFGLYGIETYLSSYTDEETVRWCAKLMRHYAIEGRADRLSRDPLVLDHLTNPDFVAGTAGWTVTAAPGGGVEPYRCEGFGWLQGRYPERFLGQSTLKLHRSDQAPNVARQTVRNLQPGRLYSLRLFSADPNDLGREQKLGLNVELKGAEVLPERSFQHVFANCYSHHFGPYDDRNKAWMNFHWIIFRADAPTAELSLSDWRDGVPAGPAGQDICVNFVQVQPYEAP